MPGFVLSTGVAKMSGHCLGLRVSIMQTIAKRLIYYHMVPERASCYLRRFKIEKKKKKKKKNHTTSQKRPAFQFS